jgi:hypothetical protein
MMYNCSSEEAENDPVRREQARKNEPHARECLDLATHSFDP